MIFQKRNVLFRKQLNKRHKCLVQRLMLTNIHVLPSYGCNSNTFAIIVDSEEGVYVENLVKDFVLRTVYSEDVHAISHDKICRVMLP